MEVHLHCVSRPDLAPLTVRTHAGATADSLLGAFWHERGLPYDPTLALYTRSNCPLRPGASLKALGVRPGDTLYMRRQRAPLLFLANWGLLAVVCGVVALLGLLLSSMAYALTGGREPFVHGIVIDAGSSHTEATLYRWKGAKYLGTGRVVQMSHTDVDNGISSLGPRGTAHTLADMVEKLFGGIPAPIYLGATAGMRVLNLTHPVEADAILLAAQCSLKPYGLQQANILSGQDEGLFAWLSTNYLLEIIPQTSDNGNTKPTVGALDLGGASTQIAFPVGAEVAENVTLLKLYSHQYNVFSVSFLCYGVNEIMRRYLAQLVNEQKFQETVVSSCHNSGHSFNRTGEDIFGSYCTKTPQTDKWLQEHPDTVFTFIGNGSADGCRQSVTILMDPANCQKIYSGCLEPLTVPMPAEQKFVAISAFYYLASAINSTKVPLQTFLDNSARLCSASWKEASQFGVPARYLSNYCFQAMYIQDLLLDKYSFNDKTWQNIAFLKKQKGFDLGWSLGFMINATNAIPEAEPSAPTVGFHLLVLLLVLFLCLLLLAALFLVLARKQSRAKLHPPA